MRPAALLLLLAHSALAAPTARQAPASKLPAWPPNQSQAFAGGPPGGTSMPSSVAPAPRTASAFTTSPPPKPISTDPALSRSPDDSVSARRVMFSGDGPSTRPPMSSVPRATPSSSGPPLKPSSQSSSSSPALSRPSVSTLRAKVFPGIPRGGFKLPGEAKYDELSAPSYTITKEDFQRFKETRRTEDDKMLMLVVQAERSQLSGEDVVKRYLNIAKGAISQIHQLEPLLSALKSKQARMDMIAECMAAVRQAQIALDLLGRARLSGAYKTQYDKLEAEFEEISGRLEEIPRFSSDMDQVLELAGMPNRHKIFSGLYQAAVLRQQQGGVEEG